MASTTTAAGELGRCYRRFETELVDKRWCCNAATCPRQPGCDAQLSPRPWRCVQPQLRCNATSCSGGTTVMDRLSPTSKLPWSAHHPRRSCNGAPVTCGGAAMERSSSGPGPVLLCSTRAMGPGAASQCLPAARCSVAVGSWESSALLPRLESMPLPRPATMLCCSRLVYCRRELPWPGGCCKGKAPGVLQGAATCRGVLPSLVLRASFHMAAVAACESQARLSDLCGEILRSLRGEEDEATAGVVLLENNVVKLANPTFVGALIGRMETRLICSTGHLRCRIAS